MFEQHAYCAFGLTIRSDIELPELFASDRRDGFDIAIELGAVPVPSDANAKFSVNGQGAFLSISGVGRYWISDGSRILIEPDSGVPLRNVRLFLLGSAMGVLLHQRGLLPLHANAVEIGGKAFAFMGRSGAGKSTLAAAFHDRGNRVIADDVCVVQFDEDSRPFACPGIPRLRLWEEALQATGRSATAYQRSFAGPDSVPKYDVPVGRDSAANDPLPLGGVFLLADGDEFLLDPLEGLDAVDAIYANTYRGKFAAMAGTTRDHWESCMTLIRTTPLFRFQRRWGLEDFDAQFAGLLDFIEKQGLIR